jgi:hypothetical protein
LISLIQRGGGTRPDEARQPTNHIRFGKVPIPTDHSFDLADKRRLKNPLLRKGVFLFSSSKLHNNFIINFSF